MDSGRRSCCKELILSLYRALAAVDLQALRLVLSEELDWWFHGPRLEQHLMRMLTGLDRLGSFSFAPLRLEVIGPGKVIVEGHGHGYCWVHVWTAKENRVTQLREYYNTSVTVFSSTVLKEFGGVEKLLPGLVLAL